MNYELAKELKDAGFPFTQYADDALLIPTMGVVQFDGLPFVYRLPFLEELIEACGEEFLGVHTPESGKWFADTKTHECKCGKGNCTGFNWENCVGSTPTEAVTRLWLALNKKVDN